VSDAIDLVTGGAGFIGSHLARALARAGRRVRVVDDLSTGHRERLADLGRNIEFIEGDLAAMDLGPALVGVGRVFHLAAIPSVPLSVADPVGSHASVVTSTIRLLQAAKTSGVDRFVYSSSCAVYGDSAESPKRESLPPHPVSPYAVAKLAGEGYVHVFAQLHGMRAVSLRYFNVFGPGQDPRSEYAAVIPRFITQALNAEPLTIYGDGQQTRDFTYVDNVVDANLRAAAADVYGGVYNIADGQAHSLLALVRELEAIVGSPLSVRHDDPRPGDIRHSLADISAARGDLGWSPRVSFSEGLSRTVAAFKGS
jgi:UDP-glucose 4-epimerase